MITYTNFNFDSVSQYEFSLMLLKHCARNDDEKTFSDQKYLLEQTFLCQKRYDLCKNVKSDELLLLDIWRNLSFN